MARNEAETRAQLIDPALHARGWTEDLIRREETLGTVEIVDGQPRRQSHGRTDYTLQIKVESDAQPIAVAVLEAKSEDKPASYGLDQAKTYQRTAKRLNVPFVIATNGHQWTLHDNRAGTTTPLPRPMADFPTPDDPNATSTEDTRTPEGLLDIIEAKGREVNSAISGSDDCSGRWSRGESARDVDGPHRIRGSAAGWAPARYSVRTTGTNRVRRLV